MEKLKERLDNFKESRILDIATGKGSFIELLMHLNKDFSEIVGIDNSEKAVEMAKKSIDNPKVSFKLMDINNMTLEKHSFDIVCLSNSIHHMSDIDECINKMLEMIKPGGILLFNEMICDNNTEKQMTHTLMHHFWAEIDTLNGVVHNETMKKQKLLDIFNGNPDIELEEYWEMKFPDEQELTEEAYTWLKGTLDMSLGRVKDNPDYETYRSKSEKLRERLDIIGFSSATQVILIVKSTSQ